LSTKPAEATAIGDELGPYARMQAIVLTRMVRTHVQGPTIVLPLRTKIVSTTSS
jgi:hypothetical protein